MSAKREKGKKERNFSQVGDNLGETKDAKAKNNGKEEEKEIKELEGKNIINNKQEEIKEKKEGKSTEKSKKEDVLEKYAKRIEELEEENRTLKDQLLRKQADFENFRKRMFREKEDAIKYANSKLLLDLTGIIDDFERAIQSAESSKDFNSFFEGVSMIEKQMTSMLEKRWGLKRFSSIGETFDPERHEAIAMEESDKYDKSVVLEDYQKGYMLHDRLLRPARVKVSKPVAVLENSEGNEENNKSN